VEKRVPRGFPARASASRKRSARRVRAGDSRAGKARPTDSGQNQGDHGFDLTRRERERSARLDAPIQPDDHFAAGLEIRPSSGAPSPALNAPLDTSEARNETLNFGHLLSG
jgi:hypothetical protein